MCLFVSIIPQLLLEYWTTAQPDSFLKYDYAMIKLKTAFALSRKINPICLPINKKVPGPLSNTIFKTAGWGDGGESKESKVILCSFFRHLNFFFRGC